MAEVNGKGPRYQVDCSGANRAALHQLQDQAANAKARKAIAAAFREIVRLLELDAPSVGEPCYRLPTLRLQVRTCIVAPLVVDFAVHEDRPLVFIKGVKLLSSPHA